MASNNSNAKFVNYTFNWKVELSDYDNIGTGTGTGNVRHFPRKYFTTAVNNVVFQWYAYFTKSKTDNSAMIRFGIFYGDGPLETIKGAGYKIGIVKGDGSIRMIRTVGGYDANRGKSWGNNKFDDKDSAAIRTKYGLQETDALVYRITMRIPMEAFTFAPTSTPKIVPHADRFQSIEKPDSSKFSDAVLISRDGIEFYCHKIIIGQTEPLETMFEKPPTKGRGTKRKATSLDNGGTTSTARKQRYEFQEMATSTLKAMIEYLYTGQSTLDDLTVTEIIVVASAADRYLLKPLKELCTAHLWKRVVDKPDSAFEFARFAHFHDDWKYLKHRAFDVIVENYQNLNIKPRTLATRFGGPRREELKDELMDYMAKRLRPDIDIGPW